MAVQTCDQAITYRNFDYVRALEIVQDEEYLDDSDFDEIRFSRKQGEVFQAIDNFQEKVANNLIQPKTRNVERANLRSGSETRKYQESNHREKRTLFFDTGSNTTTGTGILDPPLRIAATVLATAAIIIVANPAPGLVPSGSPQPGFPGGGGLPSANPGNILDLVPAGLEPVATFPPFDPAGRTIPAVAVIFREPPCTVAGTDLTNPERSFGFSPRPTLLDRFLKNVRCFRPRLAAKFGKNPAPVVSCGFGKAKYFFLIDISCM